MDYLELTYKKCGSILWGLLGCLIVLTLLNAGLQAKWFSVNVSSLKSFFTIVFFITGVVFSYTGFLYYLEKEKEYEKDDEI